MKMLPRTEHVYCDLPGHIHVFKVVPPVPSNFRKWAVDGEALEVAWKWPPFGTVCFSDFWGGEEALPQPREVFFREGRML